MNDPFLYEVVQATVRTILFLLLPLFLVVRPFRWRLRETGLNVRTQSWDVTIFALEEFSFQGVIQSLLDCSLGQGKAILWGGVLFGLTHIGLDVSALEETDGVQAILSALVLQTQAGWLFGIIFMKTRSL